MAFPRPWSPILIVLLLVSILGTACAGSAPAAIPELAIQAADFSFTAPDSIPGGLTRISMTNIGKEDHHAQLARLNDGVTVTQFQDTLKKGEAAVFPLVTFEGGAGGMPAGGKSSGLADLPSGQYLVLCFFPSPDGTPHLVKGMIKSLPVTAKPAKAPTPPKAQTVDLGDFSFTGVAASYGPGSFTLEGVNKGKQVHELIAVKVADGVTAEQLRQILSAPPSAGGPPPGPPPFAFAGGMQAVMAGAKAYGEFNLQPGQYAFLCFVPDPSNGTPRVALGMYTPFTVK
ncbi:MAG: hypothetical protein FJ316_03175 [SAR202 cluster bacterium]|nr:hypothetical protein [SAR202 cluster bacterium]